MQSSKVLEYRADLDGLKALAVFAAIFFHAEFEWFRGGFIGVDIFFVISGFLITSIISCLIISLICDLVIFTSIQSTLVD